MAKIEELFGSGDLLGVEVSIAANTGEIVIYSDELNPGQKQRIEEALGEVTYHHPLSYGRQLGGGSDCNLDETHLDDATVSECPKQEIIRRLGG